MQHRHVIRLGAVIAGAALALVAATVPPSSAADDASISVVQGLPGGPVEVTVDGDPLGEPMATATVAGPFPVPSGEHTFEFTRDGETVATSQLSLDAGSSAHLVLHLPAAPDGDPLVTRYADDLSAVQDGKTALGVAHTAAVGPADIRVDEQVLFANVANGEFLYEVVPSGTYAVDIVPTGQTSPAVLGPLDLTVAPGTLTWVFAVGDPSSTTMDVVVHELGVATTGSERPEEVATGTGGQAARLLATG